MASSHLGEFARIARYFRPLAVDSKVSRELADDAAVFSPPAGRELVITTDAMVEGIHYLPDERPDRLARKLLRVNLSDLAAMGAEALGYLLTLALPKRMDEAWLGGFSQGLGADQKTYGIALWGGDSVSTEGPPVLSLTAFGSVPPGEAIARSGARPGDGIWVSGSLGDARLGLAVLQGELPGLAPPVAEALTDRYHLPQPRLDVGRGLRGVATALMDLSDGLAGDAARIAEASGVAMAIDAAAVPLSEAGRAAVALREEAFRLALAGGDDYELLFTAPDAAAGTIDALARRAGIALTRVGRVEAGQGVRFRDADGSPIEGLTGWQHF